MHTCTPTGAAAGGGLQMEGMAAADGRRWRRWLRCGREWPWSPEHLNVGGGGHGIDVARQPPPQRAHGRRWMRWRRRGRGMGRGRHCRGRGAGRRRRYRGAGWRRRWPTGSRSPPPLVLVSDGGWHGSGQAWPARIWAEGRPWSAAVLDLWTATAQSREEGVGAWMRGVWCAYVMGNCG